MHIEIDEKSGFCFGVVKAITKAEQSLSELGRVCSLGDIVHNRVEVQRLEKLGLETISHDELRGMSGRTVLIRAHGEPPSTYDFARRHGIRLIDATCPVVARLQKLVKSAHEEMKACGGQVVILGKRGHAEVVGLTGQVDGDAIVVETPDDLQSVDFSRPIPHLQQFARRFDAIVFVCGRKSSNGKVLYQTCLQSNPRSYTVEDESELRPEWFEGCRSVGICGATSTPKWLMQRVADRIGQAAGGADGNDF